jgi:hypothetical protein
MKSQPPGGDYFLTENLLWGVRKYLSHGSDRPLEEERLICFQRSLELHIIAVMYTKLCPILLTFLIKKL